MFGRRRREREVATWVRRYDEGRRLMRQGDGADEWVGQDITREALRRLVALGRNHQGEKVDTAGLVHALRLHGLHTEAAVLAEEAASA